MKEIAGARIVENREVARGTRWLVLEAEEELPDVYAPGHIVAVYVPDHGGRAAWLDGASAKWVRHPYTVSWAEEQRIGVLYRVVSGGRTSPYMATMQPGETLRIGGRFGEPVARLVGDAPLIGVSTGTGIGPLQGFARVAGDHPVTILAGFRERVDVPFAEELEALSAARPTFAWRPVLSRPDVGWSGLRGHVSAHVAAVAVPGAHWHLVGNGAMVTDVRAGLLAAGVEPARVTTEIYFNKGTEADPAVVAAIVRGMAGR